ncbi:MAG TPA: P1 family peptidase [Solirubrobacteraceae bacterium]|nr:P1 family peptidase [Solirubrobacteraceae bacterium]
MDAALPAGFTLGHWTDADRGTGCTVVLPPPGSVAAGEVRGGGPGTRESDILSPAANVRGVQAILLAGGSAFGLAAADGVQSWLLERGAGYTTRGGLVPLVSAAVVYDLVLGDGEAHPGPADGYAACEAAGRGLARGTVGVGTGCSVGKLLGFDGWTKGGFGAATLQVDGATVTAIAAVNAAGEVVGEDGEVLAGVWRDGAYARTTDLLVEGVRPPWAQARENTTLVCVLTDASLDKGEAWLTARATTAGVSRAVAPSATPADGDMVFCLATGERPVERFPVMAVAAEVAARAVRDAVRSATGLHGCPAATERGAG